MISSKFPKSFRGARDLVVFYNFFSDFSGFFSDFPKFTKHHQVTSTPKTLRKFAWNHLTVLWLNFQRNWRFLFSTVQALLITYHWLVFKMTPTEINYDIIAKTSLKSLYAKSAFYIAVHLFGHFCALNLNTGLFYLFVMNWPLSSSPKSSSSESSFIGSKLSHIIQIFELISKA